MVKDKRDSGPVAVSMLDSRWRLTLPLAIRRHLGLRPGSRLMFTEAGGCGLIVSLLPEVAPLARSSDIAHTKGNRDLDIGTTAELIRQGHLVSSTEFQKLMGWSTRRAVLNALASNRVFAMALGAETYFPAFFADLAYPRKQLAAVSKRLGALPGGAKMQFFLSRKASLNGKTVLEALVAGEPEKVLSLAEAYAEE